METVLEIVPPPDYQSPLFRDELCMLLYRYSMENGSDTPNYILTDYLVKCLVAFDETVNRRSQLEANRFRPAETR